MVAFKVLNSVEYASYVTMISYVDDNLDGVIWLWPTGLHVEREHAIWLGYCYVTLQSFDA